MDFQFKTSPGETAKTVSRLHSKQYKVFKDQTCDEITSYHVTKLKKRTEQKD